MQAMSHVVKTRRRILRNNERLAKASSSSESSSSTRTPSSDSVRDQGFTRPKVLILSPFRNSALEWTRTLLHLAGSTSRSNSKNQDYPPADNAQRFESEYNLPSGSVDKLNQIPKEEIQKAGFSKSFSHVETFRGNIDDSFTLGIKLTGKGQKLRPKLYSRFYESDLIVASPLGLRLAIEKDGDYDFLSSIEVLVVDQMDVMLMQNWDHVQVSQEFPLIGS